MDLTGQKFGRLTIIEFVGRNRHYTPLWRCACECGSESIATTSNLRKGTSQSCGCLQKELASARTKTHGMSHTKLFIKWQSMNRRCNDPRCNSYKNYGARGISVCNEWRDSFEAFYKHVSILPNYGEKGYTLDRENNDGHYEPGNVKWSTAIEQHRNTRRNIMLTFDGRTLCLAEWANIIGISTAALHKRLKKGWGVDKALSTPVDSKKATSKKKGVNNG